MIQWPPTGRRPGSLDGQYDEDEAATVKLAYDSMLIIDSRIESSERYIPSSNSWKNDATVPDLLCMINMVEKKALGFLLPNGNAFFIGAALLFTP